MMNMGKFVGHLPSLFLVLLATAFAFAAADSQQQPPPPRSQQPDDDGKKNKS
jgi:hypothetical protein